LNNQKSVFYTSYSPLPYNISQAIPASILLLIQEEILIKHNQPCNYKTITYLCGMKEKKDSETEKEIDSIAMEPQAEYGKKTLHIYNSFEEQESANYKWLASLTPEQHLHNAVELIKRVYGINKEKELNKEGKERILYFD
jgi:hypothetical protein